MTMLRLLCAIPISIALIAQPSLAAERVALLIGNSAYHHTRHLESPIRDITGLAKVLESQGFHVTRAKDLTRRHLSAKLKDFGVKLRRAKVGFFYYAGHALHIGKDNYFVPIDAKLVIADNVRSETVPFSELKRALANASEARIIALDASHHNPLVSISRYQKRKDAPISKGLAVVSADAGTLVISSAAPGRVLPLAFKDGKSNFAKAMIRHLASTGTEITELFKSVRQDVSDKTYGNQIPWIQSSLNKGYVFAPLPVKQPPGPSASKTKPRGKIRAELAVWSTVKNSGDPKLIKVYLDKYPNGVFSKVARKLLANYRKNNAALEPPAVPKAENAATPSGPKTQPTAALEQPVKTPPSRPPYRSAPTATELPRLIQAELKRLSCYTGKLNDDWSAKLKRGLRKVAAERDIDIDTKAPKLATLKLLEDISDPVCESKATATDKSSSKKSKKRASKKKYKKKYARKNKRSKRRRSRKKQRSYNRSRSRSNHQRSSSGQTKMDWKQFWVDQADKGAP